jgi:hypothetical protein
MVDLLLLLVRKRGGYLSALFLILAKSDTHEQRYIRIGALWQMIGHFDEESMGMKTFHRRRRWNRWIASMETKRFVVI